MYNKTVTGGCTKGIDNIRHLLYYMILIFIYKTFKCLILLIKKEPVRMRAFPVIVLEMGTRHGHQVSRPSAPTNQTGRSRNLRMSSVHTVNEITNRLYRKRYAHNFALRKTHYTSSSWFVKVSLFGK